MRLLRGRERRTLNKLDHLIVDINKQDPALR
jgi:hypothetical protein